MDGLTTDAAEMTNEELVIAAKTDEALMETALKKFYPLCRYYARMYWTAGADRDRADMLSELHAGLWKAIKDFDPSRTNGSFLAFAHLALTRQAISVVKASWRLKHQPMINALRLDRSIDKDDEESSTIATLIADARGVDPESAILNGELVESLRRALSERLSDREAHTFELYLRGFSYAEIAERLEPSATGRAATSKDADNNLNRVRHKVIPAVVDALECWRSDLAY